MLRVSRTQSLARSRHALAGFTSIIRVHYTIITSLSFLYTQSQRHRYNDQFTGQHINHTSVHSLCYRHSISITNLHSPVTTGFSRSIIDNNQHRITSLIINNHSGQHNGSLTAQAHYGLSLIAIAIRLPRVRHSPRQVHIIRRALHGSLVYQHTTQSVYNNQSINHHHFLPQ